ncbi:MAG TPA: TrkA family potassium uptake protein [Polyangiales bacterium]|nr:TrkA family potassium uptake protein [Polyangiales bacterium]
MIVGAGLAGTNLARDLGAAGHAVTLVDRDSSIAERGFVEHGLATIVGDGTDPRVLRDADVGRADVVAAMLRRDADNLAVGSIARSEGARRILARLRDPAYRSIYANAGIDQVFGEVETMVGALSVAIEHPRVRHSMVLGSGDSIAFEIEVQALADTKGNTVREIGSHKGFPRGAVIAGIAGVDGAVRVPRGDTEVRVGDVVLLVTRRNDVAMAIDFFARTPE